MITVQKSSLSLQQQILEPTIDIEQARLTKLLHQSHSGSRILLVRHGETDWNRQKRFQGWRDVPLNQTGRQQARFAAELLKPVQIDRAFSSPMSRARETAKIILNYHPRVSLELRHDLKEISHGSWDGLLESQVKLMYPEQLRRWKEAPATAQLPEGENLQQVWERAIPVWQSIVKSTFEASAIPKTVLVVAHSTVNKVILCHVSGKGLEHFWNFKQDNCAINIIDYPEGYDAPAEVQAMNISTHIADIK